MKFVYLSIFIISALLLLSGKVSPPLHNSYISLVIVSAIVMVFEWMNITVKSKVINALAGVVFLTPVLFFSPYLMQLAYFFGWDIFAIALMGFFTIAFYLNKRFK